MRSGTLTHAAGRPRGDTFGLLRESAETRADRVHAALSAMHERLHSAVPGGSFEQRTGHARMLLPSVPRALFNGVLVDAVPCSGIAELIAEVELAAFLVACSFEWIGIQMCGTRRRTWV